MFGPQVEPNEQMKSMSKGLYVIFFIGLALAFCKFAGGSTGSSLALNEIIGLLLLVCGIYSYNYCLLVVFIVLVLFNMLQFVMLIGKDIQNSNNPFKDQPGSFQFFYAVIIITFVYDIVACVFCFRAYKIFKYEALKGFIGSGALGGGQPVGGNNYNPGDNQQNPPQGNNFNAFQGQGVRIG